jgi:hypothetical protein
LAERLSAASYGTVLVLAALALVDEDEVSSGLGWELVTGVGVATWIAHLYAEVVGDQLHGRSAVDRTELTTAMVDGVPILVAAFAPAVMLLLGRIDVLDDRTALWAAVAVAVLQLVGIGAIVGSAVSSSRVGGAWSYAAVVSIIGVGVVALKVAFGH